MGHIDGEALKLSCEMLRAQQAYDKHCMASEISTLLRSRGYHCAKGYERVNGMLLFNETQDRYRIEIQSGASSWLRIWDNLTSDGRGEVGVVITSVSFSNQSDALIKIADALEAIEIAIAVEQKVRKAAFAGLELKGFEKW